jgi:hypothetical protein
MGDGMTISLRIDDDAASVREAARRAGDALRSATIQGLWLSNSGFSVKHSGTLCPSPGTRLSLKSILARAPDRFMIVPFGFGLPGY